MYARTSDSNTKYNTKYNCFSLGSLIDILYRFANVNHQVLNTQLSIIITGLLTQILHAIYRNISKMADQSPRMHYVVSTVTSSGCLKLYLNPWELSEVVHLLYISITSAMCSIITWGLHTFNAPLSHKSVFVLWKCWWSEILMIWDFCKIFNSQFLAYTMFWQLNHSVQFLKDMKQMC